MAWRETPGKDFGNVSPVLLSLLRQAAANSPYTVEAYSGYRKGDPRQHGRGHATDVRLIDPKTGKALPNYQDPAAYKAYQQYANAVYSSATPEQQKALRWGGYFSGGKGKYGALDLMHFDYGAGIPMGGGSWEGGLTPQQAKVWGLASGGGVNGSTMAMAQPQADPRTATDKPGVLSDEATVNANTAVPAKPSQNVIQPASPYKEMQGPPVNPYQDFLTAQKEKDKQNERRDALADAVSGLGKMGGGSQMARPQYLNPKAARIDEAEMPTVAGGGAADPSRQQLAMMMARLNSGKLFV